MTAGEPERPVAKAGAEVKEGDIMEIRSAAAWDAMRSPGCRRWCARRQPRRCTGCWKRTRKRCRNAAMDDKLAALKTAARP